MTLQDSQTFIPKKYIEHGIHHASQSRQEKKRYAMFHTCANLFSPRPELCIKVESISVFLDITKVADIR